MSQVAPCWFALVLTRPQYHPAVAEIQSDPGDPMPYETLLLDIKDEIAKLTLNRPDKLNSFNRQLLQDFHAAMREIIEDATARALVVTGAGRAFSSGADLQARGSEGNPKDPEQRMRDWWLPAFYMLREAKMPTIAAVNGICAGAGVSMALSCDFVIAQRSAYFLQAFVNVGLVPDMGATWFFPHRIGDARAKRLLMLGEKLPAEQAEQWGLIYKVVDDDKLMDEAMALARKLATGPTRTYAMIRELLRVSWQNELPAQVELERKTQALATKTPDANEAISAFLEKRTPKFTGK
jgi:2-(1,2-epoxy-1,2-dihydrophenyl)acetyl-CoA isomerase